MIKKMFIVVIASILFAFFLQFNANKAQQNSPINFDDKVVLNLSNNHDDFSIDSKKHKNVDSTISVVLQYEPTHFHNIQTRSISSQEALLKHRKKLKTHYTAINETVTSELDLRNYSRVYLSNYGPFILYKYEKLSDFLEKDFLKIKKQDSEQLLNVYVENQDFIDMATRNSYDNVEVYPFEDALNDIGLEDSNYKGNGIKIGSIESGVPNNYTNLSNVVYETYGTYQTSHAFKTSSIYGGNGGIASEAEIYFAALNNYSFLESTDWLISKGVNLINRSNGASWGTYTSSDAYADYIVRETKVTFVNSAGNSYDNESIASPSVGLNVISVAANDNNFAISYFSSAGLTSPSNEKISKPTISAPGHKITGVPNVFEELSGTSFSAPMVTGIVALLMEEFEDLKYSPEKVINILTNSTNYALGQKEEFDHDAGFGIINYKKSRTACLNAKKQILTNSVTSNAEVFQKEVEIPFGETIHAEVFTLYNSNFTSTSGNPDINSIKYSQFKILIINNHNGTVYSEYYNNSNFSNLTYSNADPNCKYFTIKILLLGDKKANSLEHYSISYYVNDDFNVEIDMVSGNKVDIPPTFKWRQTNVWKYTPFNTFDLVFLDSSKKEILRINNINKSRCVPSVLEWEQILSSIGSKYYVYVAGFTNHTMTIKRRISDLYKYTKPNTHAIKYTIYPENYGYEQQYFFYSKYKVESVDNFTFETTRLRTGYIEQEYINLSPRRIGAGTAYLEYKFSQKIYRIDVNLSFWSAHEYINSSNSNALLQYKNKDGEWVIALNLLLDVNLSKDRYNQDTYSVLFPEGTFEYRFYMNAPAVGNRNKGRISIGKTTFYTE